MSAIQSPCPESHPCQEPHPHVMNPIPSSGTPSPVPEPHPQFRNPIPSSGTPSPCQEPHPHARNPIPMSGTPSPCLEPHHHVRTPTKCPLHLKRKFGLFWVFQVSDFSDVCFNLTACGFNLTSCKIISFTTHGNIPKIVVQQPRFHQ